MSKTIARATPTAAAGSSDRVGFRRQAFTFLGVAFSRSGELAHLYLCECAAGRNPACLRLGHSGPGLCASTVGGWRAGEVAAKWGHAAFPTPTFFAQGAPGRACLAGAGLYGCVQQVNRHGPTTAGGGFAASVGGPVIFTLDGMNTDACTIVADVKVAFADAGLQPPHISLRAGDALDDYDTEPPHFDAVLDEPTDAYLERYFWGIGYLDATSLHHYLPRLVEYSLGHLGAGSAVGEFLISALCPPDREPPRLASFSPAQERALTRVLDFLAFTDGSAYQASAQRALEEWWAPGALYRGQNAV